MQKNNHRYMWRTTDHINVVRRKFADSLMRRVTASYNSIVTAIVSIAMHIISLR